MVEGFAYRFDLYDAIGNLIQTLDNLYGINDLSVNSGPLPSSSISFLQAGSGAVTRTGQSKMRDVVSVMDFGAKGDGSTDDHAAFTLALAYASTLRGRVFVPATVNGYYMGSTGISIPDYTAMYGDDPRLIWSSAFTGTAVTVGYQSTLEHIQIYMPKSVAVPAATIVAIDLSASIGHITHCRVDQTSTGNNSPWYTGIKMSGTGTGGNSISNTIQDSEVYSYSFSILGTGGTARNDLSIRNNILVSQIDAPIAMPQWNSTTIAENDIETTGLYCIWLLSATSEIAGGTIRDNYMQGATATGIWVDAAAGFPSRGLVIEGNEINVTTTPTAITLKYTESCTVSGNYVSALTNWLNLDTSNIDLNIGTNFTNGKTLLQSGVHTGFRFETSTWTPSIGGSATYTNRGGTYTKIGSRVFGEGFLTVNALGTGSATTISGIPYARSGTIPGGVVITGYSGLAGGNFVEPEGEIDATTITFSTMAAAGIAITNPASIFGNGAFISFSFNYPTDVI